MYTTQTQQYKTNHTTIINGSKYIFTVILHLKTILCIIVLILRIVFYYFGLNLISNRHHLKSTVSQVSVRLI